MVGGSEAGPQMPAEEGAASEAGIHFHHVMSSAGRAIHPGIGGADPSRLRSAEGGKDEVGHGRPKLRAAAGALGSFIRNDFLATRTGNQHTTTVRRKRCTVLQM
jgi:hypothetical protein